MADQQTLPLTRLLTGQLAGFVVHAMAYPVARRLTHPVPEQWPDWDALLTRLESANTLFG